MQNTYTPQYGLHGNLIRSLSTKTTDGEDLTITIECSDILASQYQGYSQKIKAVKVEEVLIIRKDLDQPLGFIKSFFAKIASIKPQHRFILLETKHFIASIDFYIGNRIVIRCGDRHFVMDQEKSKARKNSQVVRESNGLEWRRIIKSEEELSFGAITEHIFAMKVKDFSQTSYKGEQFSQELFNFIQYHLVKHN